MISMRKTRADVVGSGKTFVVAQMLDALVSFTFDLGAGALQRSTLRRKINSGEHDEVPAELMKWVWAAGKRLPGLIRRRRSESNHYQNKIITDRSPLVGLP